MLMLTSTETGLPNEPQQRTTIRGSQNVLAWRGPNLPLPVLALQRLRHSVDGYVNYLITTICVTDIISENLLCESQPYPREESPADSFRTARTSGLHPTSP